MRLTDGEGVELVQDFIGAPYLERNLSILKTRGRMVMVGLMGGAYAEQAASQMAMPPDEYEPNHAETVTGLRIGREKQACVRRIFDATDREGVELGLRNALSHGSMAAPAQGGGKIQPIIDCVMPLSDASEAHAYMEANRNFGKIILKVE